MLLNIMFLPTPGTIEFPVSNDLQLVVKEIQGTGTTSITQHVGRYTYSYAPGDSVAAGLPLTITTDAPATIYFDTPGAFSIVTDVSSIPAGGAAILDNGSQPPRLVRTRADGTRWYGSPMSTTP